MYCPAARLFVLRLLEALTVWFKTRLPCISKIETVAVDTPWRFICSLFPTMDTVAACFDVNKLLLILVVWSSSILYLSQPGMSSSVMVYSLFITVFQLSAVLSCAQLSSVYSPYQGMNQLQFAPSAFMLSG